MKNASTTLALDIGGTKIAAALVETGRILRRCEFPMSRGAGADGWFAEIFEKTVDWQGQFGAVGAAVTGLVTDGRWSAVNPQTLPVPPDFPLVERLSAMFGVPANAWNDAQAAAWGEFRQGVGAQLPATATMAFLTVSTGIGGGVVAGGRLLGGLAGHFGQSRLSSGIGDEPAEACISGRWIAAAAAEQGHAPDAKAVFAASRRGEGWAEALLQQSAARFATLCLNVQFAVDPQLLAVGGGIGLAPGYLDRVRAALSRLSPRLAPRLMEAGLGADAGLLGAADLAETVCPVNERN
ncbi:ROK family protein [Consotaella aegiceratis]|uniref:ROK family protein n=1 Tax=Consotaella aegiceratis TaxID=3097961 RepID=UPI003D802F21